MNPLTITAYSTALYSTWIFVDELGILFDCGDGAAAGLLQKGRKVNMRSSPMRTGTI
ncbi:MAG: ribonuclease Z [Bradymonadia bacterium]|jgi:ribonuclease Z